MAKTILSATTALAIVMLAGCGQEEEPEVSAKAEEPEVSPAVSWSAARWHGCWIGAAVGIWGGPPGAVGGCVGGAIVGNYAATAVNQIAEWWANLASSASDGSAATVNQIAGWWRIVADLMSDAEASGETLTLEEAGRIADGMVAQDTLQGMSAEEVERIAEEVKRLMTEKLEEAAAP
jgi:hypothetical protein